jgi:periplasmic copper chaperone A
VNVRSASIVVAIVALLVAPSVAAAHVTLQPPEWEAGGFARFVVRVPNERDDAATTEVSVKFPPEVIEARFQPIDGWEREIRMADLDQPIEAEGEEPITEKIDTVTWSGGRIEPGEFQEFGVSFQVPEDAAPGTMLSFPSIQTYSSGEVVRWIGPEESDEPAPLVEVLEAPPEGEEAAATPAATPAPAAETGAAAEEEGGTDTLSIVALIVGALGLIVAIVALLGRGGTRPEPPPAREQRKEEVGVS